jgi:hypothetical protein
MSFLHERLADDRELERYLLGLLPEEDEERLDQASVEDDSVALRLRIAEDDLIEGYVRRTLATETRQRFETYYLSSLRRRERVAFAARFLGAVDRAAVRADLASGGSHSESATPVLHSKLVPGVLASAAVLVVAFGLMLLNSGQLGDLQRVAGGESAALQRARREPDQQLPEPRVANPPPVTGQEPVKGLETPGRLRPLAPAAGPSEAQEATTIALVLLPQMRASGPAPVLALPSGADRVAFELRLEPNDASRYEVALKDPATGRAVWRSEWLAKTSSGDEASLVVVVPARALKPQHYVFHLNVPSSGGQTDVVGSYSFQVLPR